MYQLEFDDLYEERYDAYDASEECVYVDGCVVSMIECLYCSQNVNKKQIAFCLNGIIREFYNSKDANIKEKDITLEYDSPMDSFEESFNAWLSCIDPITGELNYRRLCDADRGFALKDINKFDSSFDALEALIAQLTTQITFSDEIISGALIFLASRYGVNFMDAINYKTCVKRKGV